MDKLIILVVLLYAAVILYDLLTEPSAVSKRTKILYFSLMFISFAVLILYVLDVPLPSPSDAIIAALDALLSI